MGFPAATSRRRELGPVGRFLENRYVRTWFLAADLVLAFLIFITILYPAPAAILFLGAVLGACSSLVAMGIVLVYRANRIINFAAGDLGALAGLLGVLLIATGWNYYLALAAGLGAALVSGALVEFLFVRRFSRAPRLILTVATLGIANILQAGQLVLPSAFGRDFAPQNFPTPFDFTWEWSPVIFSGSHLLAIIVVIACGIALGAFFRFTRIGVAVRASAESSERALQLGIPVKRLGTLVWTMAAALAAIASLLRAPIVGVPIGRVLGPALLLRALAAAVIGRMENLPVTFAAGVVLGMVEQAVFWATSRTVIIDVVLMVIILGAIVLQRTRRSRAEDAAVSSWEMVKEVRPVPPELDRVPLVRYGFTNLRFLLVALLAVLPLLMSPSRVNLLGTGLILAMVGISLVVLTGWAGEVSLGQMALFGAGAAMAAKGATLGWHIFACLFAAGVVGAIVSTAIGIPALRIRGPFLAVSTFAFALATSSFFLNEEFLPWFVVSDRVLRPLLFGKFDLESEHAFYMLCFGTLVLMLVSVRSIKHSRIGRVLVAARDNPRAAQAYGISVIRARLVAFAFSGFFAAMAGGLFAFHQHALGRSAFEPEQSIRIFSMVVFGGLGSIPGVLAGAAWFTGLDYFVRLPGTRLLISGLGLLVILLILPGGLGQVIYGLRDGILRRVARKRQIVVPSLVADVRGEEPRALTDQQGLVEVDPAPAPVGGAGGAG